MYYIARCILLPWGLYCSVYCIARRIVLLGVLYCLVYYIARGIMVLVVLDGRCNLLVGVLYC